ncbi:MAG: ABC transporter substrate-binding protein [Anaerolineaceae bacterium]|nr:ABC transporter substrate-binding protein [Anaerolineaceae bacterium]
MKKTISAALLLLLTTSLLLAACAPAQPAGPVKIRAAVLPVLDVLPMVVAQTEGLYAKHNLDVELLPVGSAPERDQLISAGQADVMVNELVSVMFLNQDQIQAQAVRYARTATSDQALFSILVAGNSGIQDVDGLKDVPVGVSQATVIEYLTDRLLAAEGLSSAEIQNVAIPKIPDRMSLLASGELKAAMLPEPFTTLALQQGATLVLDDRQHPEYSYSVISFRKAMIDEQPDAVKAFLAAIEEATTLINQDPQQYSDLMVEQNMVPAPVAGAVQVPTYPTAGVPDESQFQDTLAWAQAKGYLSQDLSYQDCVNGSLLP